MSPTKISDYLVIDSGPKFEIYVNSKLSYLGQAKLFSNAFN